MMNELAKIDNYSEFREALGTELKNQSEGFVRTGYLLKKARDTDILKESGYTTVAEFAQAEYGLTKDIVSRYIAINDRYSKNGYSEYLEEQYEGFGIAKLQEMLTLPDSVVTLINPEMTRREIQDIKQEIREEEKITDIEVCLEGNAPNQEHMTLLQKVINKYFHENRQQYIELTDVITSKLSIDEAIDKALEVLAPSGMAIKTVRIQGVGRLIISFKGKNNDIEMLNIRTNVKENIHWKQFLDHMITTFGGKASIEDWEKIYQEPYEEKKEDVNLKVAPVQQAKTIEETSEGKKQDEVIHEVEKNIEKNEEIVRENEENTEEDQITEIIVEDTEEKVETQVPGQTDIEHDFPEYMPTPIDKKENVKRGYAASVTNNLKRLQTIWEGTSKLKLDMMLETIKDLTWRVEQIKKLEDENNV